MSTLPRYRGIVKGAFPAAIIILTIFAILPGIGWGQPIAEGFNNFDTGTRPAGWTFNGCNANSDTYTAAGDFGLLSPSIKLDTTGDSIQTQTLFHPDALTFWVKGMATDTSSALLVEEYYSGGGWNTLTNVMPLPAAGTNFGPYSMDFFSTEARFTYTKSVGDLAFDDVGISAAAPTATLSVTPTRTPTTPTPTLTPPPTATPTPYTNIPNHSFELGAGTDPANPILGWTRVAAKPYVARSTDQAYDATYSCTFSSTGYVTDEYSDQGIRSDAVSSIIGGDDYDIGGWFRVEDEGGAIADTQFKFNIEWLDSLGNIISTDSDSDWHLAAFDTWEEKEYRVTAPLAAVQVQIYLAAKETNNPNSDVYIDFFNLKHAPAITVSAPALYDAWYINNVYNITWISYDVTGNVDIHYSTNGTDWVPVASNIADSGSYAWTIPNDPSDQALVRVQETGGIGVSGQSDQFSIAERDTINVTSPDGGEVWYRSVAYDITWTYGPDVGAGNVDLDYSVNNGSSWTSIDTGVGIGASPYSWTIPDEDSTHCLVRVSQPSSGISGQSPAVFSMASPAFTVTSPAGGEYWYYNSLKTITWTFTTGITGNVNIDYSTTGDSGPWLQIASNQPNTGSYSSWTIPKISTTTARVRLSEIGGVSLPGISPNNFTLKAPAPPQPYVELEWRVMPEIPTVDTCSILSIEAFDPNNVWVGCSCGLIYHWNGQSWTLQNTCLGGNRLFNVKEFVALSSDSVFCGGQALAGYDGSCWENYGGIEKTIYSMDGPDPEHILAGAASGTVAIWNPNSSSWNTSSIGDSGSLYGTVYLRPGEAYVLRKGSSTKSTEVFYPLDASFSSWTTFVSLGGLGVSNHPLGGCIDQNGNSLLWVVGDCGFVGYFNGSAWSLQTQSGYNNFKCVEVLDEQNVWAFAEGMIYHYNGSEWFIEEEGLSSITQISAADNRHVYGVTSSKVYYTFAQPTPTPWISVPPTPDIPTPTRTPVPVPGPISGRVYDRDTGVGIAGLYVRALPTQGGLMPGGARTDLNGYYTTYDLDAGLYDMWVDSNSGSGVRIYRSQWYNQKDSQSLATAAGSNSTGIDFPLYKEGVYPTPDVIPTPTPDFQTIRVAGSDYSGDGLADIAIFRPGSGLWAVRAVTRLYFGTTGDIPVSGDYDGDGTADVALFRSSSGLWAIRNVSRAYFGTSSDIPAPGDYDGDGLCDIGIFRGGSGLWAIKGITRSYFGTSSDQPVSGDYDGDGIDDIAVFRGGSGLWALQDISRIYYGSSADTLVPGDYAGSGTAVPAIFRPSSGLWSIRGLTRVYFGSAANQPVPAAFSGSDDIGIFQPSSGLWAIRGITRVYFGSSADLPVTK